MFIPTEYTDYIEDEHLNKPDDIEATTLITQMLMLTDNKTAMLLRVISDVYADDLPSLEVLQAGVTAIRNVGRTLFNQKLRNQALGK